MTDENLPLAQGIRALWGPKQEENVCTAGSLCWTQKLPPHCKATVLQQQLIKKRQREKKARTWLKWVSEQGPQPSPWSKSAWSRERPASGCIWDWTGGRTWASTSLEGRSATASSVPQEGVQSRNSCGTLGRPAGPGPPSGTERGHILCRARRVPTRLKQREGVSRGCTWGRGHAAADGGTDGTSPEQTGTQASPRMPKTGHASVHGPSGATTTSVEDGGDRWQPRTVSTKAFQIWAHPSGVTARTQTLTWLKKNPELTENTLNG